ncbi:MAG TPA: HAD-IB family phosphatase [Thermoanaerobaculia bacterium]|nr:HAD-IB family phosphatase [Thermoanaerobaculia bacterium]
MRRGVIPSRRSTGGAGRGEESPADGAISIQRPRARYRLVFFDVDSTLVTIEGIDVLGKGNAEVVRLTQAAMNGEIPLGEVYGRRLEMIRPSRDAVERLAQNYLASLVEGAEKTVQALRAAGAEVHLITAGIRQAVEPLALRLGLEPRAVHAVALHFSDDGEYADFDRRSFLTRGGGKEVMVRDVRARSHGSAAMIGDGVSDLEAKPAVDLFIGFGGVTVREKVKQNADVYIEDSSLTAVLPHLLEE